MEPAVIEVINGPPGQSPAELLKWLKGVRAAPLDDRCFRLAQEFWSQYSADMSPLTGSDPEFESLCARHWARGRKVRSVPNDYYVISAPCGVPLGCVR